MADDKTQAPRATTNRSTVPVSSTFKDYISNRWAERAESQPTKREQAEFAASRRTRISAMYAGKRLIVPAGAAKVRSNDTDYAYRAHSAFAHLTGWGSDSVPGSVLVFEPTPSGHDATLYFRKAAGRDSDEFYANPEIGEFWTGPRPSLESVTSDLGLATASLDGLAAVLDAVDANTLVVRDGDRDLTDQVDGRRLLAADTESLETTADTDLARDLRVLTLEGDAHDLYHVRGAVAAQISV